MMRGQLVKSVHRSLTLRNLSYNICTHLKEGEVVNAMRLVDFATRRLSLRDRGPMSPPTHPLPHSFSA